MNGLLILIPVALILGGLGVGAFFWSLRARQFEDPEGAAHRILLDDDLEPQDEGDDAPNVSR